MRICCAGRGEWQVYKRDLSSSDNPLIFDEIFDKGQGCPGPDISDRSNRQKSVFFLLNFPQWLGIDLNFVPECVFYLWSVICISMFFAFFFYQSGREQHCQMEAICNALIASSGSGDAHGFLEFLLRITWASQITYLKAGKPRWTRLHEIAWCRLQINVNRYVATLGGRGSW